MSISKNQIKLITSLKQKKFRIKEGLFVVEGIKVTEEFLKSNFELDKLFCTADCVSDYGDYAPELITEFDLKKISNLKSPNKVVALFRIPKPKVNNKTGLKVILDGVNDPGNLGTIIRLCDWFGVDELICSEQTVDCYNSKVVQSTMGSLTRVVINYTNINMYLENTRQPVYVTDMRGENIYTSKLPANGIIVMGNEANGVSYEVKKRIQNKLTIPRFGNIQATESLNVATATSIVLSEFRRSTEM